MPSPSVEPSLQPEPSVFESDGDELRRYRMNRINRNLTIETPARVSSKLHDLNHNLSLDKVPALPRGEQSIRRDPHDPARGFDFYKCQQQRDFAANARRERKRDKERVVIIAPTAKVWLHVYREGSRFPEKLPFGKLNDARARAGHHSRLDDVTRVDVVSDGYRLEYWAAGRKNRA